MDSRGEHRGARVALRVVNIVRGPGVVLEGVVIGALMTLAGGVLTFGLHAKLPYRKLLIITGVMLLIVLLVSVGEEVNEMELAGWFAFGPISWLHLPGWMGTWFSLKIRPSSACNCTEIGVMWRLL